MGNAAVLGTLAISQTGSPLRNPPSHHGKMRRWVEVGSVLLLV